MSKPRAALRAAGWVTVGVVAASGVGVATAATTGGSGGGHGAVTTSATTTSATTTSPSLTSTNSKAKPGTHRKHRLAARLTDRLLHGQATVLGKDGKPVQVAEQRGTVEAVSPTSITLKSKDGFPQTYVVGTDTRVRVDGKKSSIAAVKQGQQAVVLAKVDGATQTARLIVERAPKG
jgi:hypothetical protein